MRTKRTSSHHERDALELPLRGRRTHKSAANSLQFFARIEGDLEQDGAHIRGANGMRWRTV